MIMQCHTFSFSVSTSPQDRPDTGIKGALGASFDLALAQAARTSTGTDRDGSVTYYGATLIVWTHADKKRTDAIRTTIENGSKARSTAIARATKAAAASRRLGDKIARQANSPMGPLSTFASSRSRTASTTSGGETELETEAFITESEWEGAAPLAQSTAKLPFLQSSHFWLPYALTIISRYPIYNIMEGEQL